MRTNAYSDLWFATFLRQVPPEKTQREVDFLVRQLPLPAYREILDLGCGPGRHAIPLAEHGFEVTGVDFHEPSIRAAEARAKGLKANFLLADLRVHPFPAASFHAVVVLWQSFGLFSSMENRRLLASWHAMLKPSGRLVLDVYNRDFFVGKDGTRIAKTPSGPLTETKRLRGKQLYVHLDYPGGIHTEDFQWEVFSVAELALMASEAGFTVLRTCSGFQEGNPVTPESPDMQFVLQKN